MYFNTLKMNLVVELLCFLSVFNIMVQNEPENENLTVTINSGTIQGRISYTPGTQKPFYSFQGIPYAQPPIDDLRFREPVPVKNWEGILPTQEDKYKCIQEFVAEGSEDCLYINVFTPNTSTTDLPVMVWIYGGAFQVGSSKITFYSPDYFLEEEVIVVTFNYRLGVFGFLSTEDSASPGNYGLKDQILALKWVRDNIEHFGGNPNSITIFGESAGSASIAYLIQTPLAKNLFHRAIMQSGTSLNLWALTRNPRNTAFAIGTSLDIETDNSTILVNALRRIQTKTLQSVSVSTEIKDTVVTNPRNGLIFGPTMEPPLKGAVIRKKSHFILNYGDFNKVPCIVGFNSEEGKEIGLITDFIRPLTLIYDILSTKFVPIDMNIESCLQTFVVGTLIRQKYFGLLPTGLSNQLVAKFVTDDQFVRAIYEYVLLVSKYTPVYFYRFSYEGLLGFASGKEPSVKGVAHGEELLYFWKQPTNIINPSEYDVIVRKRLIKLWTNFAKVSNPTPGQDELLQNVIWPTALFKDIKYLDIGRNLVVKSNMTSYNIQFWKDLYKINGFPPYDTY